MGKMKDNGALTKEDVENAVELMMKPPNTGPVPLCFVGRVPIYTWKELQNLIEQLRLEKQERRNHERKE